MWFVLANSMLSWKERTLQMRASRVNAALQHSLRGSGASSRPLEDVVAALPEGEWIQIVAEDGQILFPVSGSALPSGDNGGCRNSSFRDRTVNRERFRELCRPVTYAGKPAFLLVPSPLSEDRILLHNFSFGLYRTIPLLLLVASGGGYMLSRRALAPVDLVIAEAQSITADDLGKRLTVPTADDQLRRLAIEWNGLLTRIQKAMTRVTQFTADASHELRSPIAYIRASAEFQLGNRQLEPEQREVFRDIFDETTSATELLENLLLLARTEHVQPARPQPPVDLRVVLADLAVRFRPLLRQHRHALVIQDTAGAVPLLRVSEGHLRRVLTAILDNAIKYTPEGESIPGGITFAQWCARAHFRHRHWDCRGAP